MKRIATRQATTYDQIDSDQNWRDWCEKPARWSGLFWGVVVVMVLCTLAVFVGSVSYLLGYFSV